MCYKEFFKPTKVKVIILVILLILTFVSSFGKISRYFCISEARIPPFTCPQPFPYGNMVFVRANDVLAFPYIAMQYVKRTIVFPYLFINAKTTDYYGTFHETFLVLGIVLTLTYQYAFSCIINFIVKRLRRNKLTKDLSMRSN